MATPRIARLGRVGGRRGCRWRLRNDARQPAAAREEANKK
jgi:hypothetical protein